MGRRWWAATAAATLSMGILVAASGGAGAAVEPPQRIWGADRYETAVAVSQRLFPSGATSVVVASGTSSADALVAGPLAVQLGGPVLLTAAEGLPPSTAAELGRLRPGRVVVVGGPAVVPPAVEEQLRAVVGVAVERLAGDDRYGTAAAVAGWFPAPSDSVLVAAGTVASDALVAAAEAANRRVPLLLTDSLALPPVTDAALARMAPREVVLVGGTGSVVEPVAAALGARGSLVTRLAGTDAAATAVAVAARRSDPSGVLVVTSTTFADGLAAVPLSAATNSPVLLVYPGCATWDVVTYQRDRRWPPVTVVGGPVAVSAAAAAAVPCDLVPLGQVAPGVVVERRVLPGPVVVHLVRVDRRVGPVFEAMTPSGGLLGRAPVSLLARRSGAAVMINGDFFTGTGVPVHMAAVGGRLLKSPGLIESVVAWDRTSPTTPQMGVPTPVVTATSGVTTVPVGRLNDGPPGAGEVAMFTPEGPDAVTLPEPSCVVELIGVSGPHMAVDGTSQVSTAGSMRCGVTALDVPTDVLVAREADLAVLAPFAAGSQVVVRWQPGPGWGPVSEVVGANLPLVRDGAVAREIEVGTVAFFTTRAPRTALGWTTSGELVLAIVDGRQPGHSIGMTPVELARFLVQVGVDDAANLDGGGSSALAVHGVLVNRPSDVGGERPVGSALAVRTP